MLRAKLHRAPLRSQLVIAQRAQLLQLERAQLLWQSRRAVVQGAAAEQSLLEASPQRRSLERQPSPGRLASHERSLGPRTLSAHLQQEERLATQRAAQQLWAQAAACLVGRAGSMKAGRLPGLGQEV